MQLDAKATIDQTLNNIPGIIGVMLMDLDGKPIYINGRIDMAVSELGAVSAACYAGAKEIGEYLAQSSDSITILAEYDSFKIYHIGLSGNAQLIILTKIKESRMGMLQSEIATIEKEFSASIQSLQNKPSQESDESSPQKISNEVQND
ncbi:roadblock/LC7 domain-containing protein [candidate division KSB1 bacterium]|nr:roadblock/LC7 domain-containing protein [candidate division KSB1 bacterium]